MIQDAMLRRWHRSHGRELKEFRMPERHPNRWDQRDVLSFAPIDSLGPSGRPHKAKEIAVQPNPGFAPPAIGVHHRLAPAAL